MPSVLTLMQRSRPLGTGCKNTPSLLFVDPPLPPMCLELSEIIKEDEIGRQRGRKIGRHLSLRGRERGRGGGCCWHEAGALCFTAPLASFCLSLSLPLTDVNNNSASTERTQVSTIVLLWMDLGEGGQRSQGHLSHLSHPRFLFTLTLPFRGFHLAPPPPTPPPPSLILSFCYHSSMFCENFSEVMHKLSVHED